MADHIIQKNQEPPHLQQLKAIITGKLLLSIPYMDKPPALGGKLLYLSHEEFYKKFNCSYFEGIKNNQHSKIAIPLNKINDPEIDLVRERLQHPLNCLAICNMGETVGHGLFALEDIGIGTVLCMYSGVLEEPMLSQYQCAGVNAEKIGGISRFMQHMPISRNTYIKYLLELTKNRKLVALRGDHPKTPAACVKYLHEIGENKFDFGKIVFSSEQLKGTIATSNVIYDTLRITGVDLIVMIAMCDIKKHEIIGFSYGEMYWENPNIHHSPLLFNKYGTVIPREGNYIDYLPALSLEKVNSSTTDVLQPVTSSLQRPIILSNILRFLPEYDTKNFAAVAKTWKHTVDDESYWRDKIHQQLTLSPVLQKEQTYKEYYKNIYGGIYQGSRYGNEESKYGRYLQKCIHSSQFMADDLYRYLSFACKYGAEIWLAELIQRGAKIDKQILNCLKREVVDSGNPMILKILLQAGADLNAHVNITYTDNPSFLHCAALSNNYKVFVGLIVQKIETITILPALHKAIITGQYTKLASLLKAGANVNEEDVCGCTALWWALIHEQENSIKILLAAGARLANIAKWKLLARYGADYLGIGNYGNYHNSALTLVLTRKNYNCLRLILEQQKDLHEEVTGQYYPIPLSPLHIAAQHDFVDGIQLLVEHGYKINDPRYAYSALHIAAKHSSLSCIKWLLENGARLNQAAKWIELDEDAKDDFVYSYTPLFLAAQEGHVECISLLLTSGAIPLTSRRLWFQRKELIDVTEVSILAAFIGNNNRKLSDNCYLQGLQLLLVNGANPNNVSTQPTSTALEVLMQEKNGATLVKCVAILLEFNADPNQTSVLHDAVRMKNLPLVKLLVEMGKANTSQKDKYTGNTPLMLAVDSGLEIFKYLLEHGANIDAVNNKGETVKSYAEKMQQTQIIEYIQQTIKIEQKEYHGRFKKCQ